MQERLEYQEPQNKVAKQSSESASYEHMHLDIHELLQPKYIKSSTQE